MFPATFFSILEGKCITTFKNPMYHPVSIANSSCLLSHCNAQVLFTRSRLCSKFA